MTALHTPEDGITALHCDTVGCPENVSVTAGSTTLEARDLHASLGWSTPALTTRARSNPHVTDYCPTCTDERSRGGAPCTRCPGGELFDLLGHNQLGHRAARVLYKHDSSLTGERVSRMTREEISALPFAGSVVTETIIRAVFNVYGGTAPNPAAAVAVSAVPAAAPEVARALQQAQRVLHRLTREIPEQLSAGPSAHATRTFAGQVARDLHQAAFAVGQTLCPPR